MINFGKVDLDTLKIIVQSSKHMTKAERDYCADEIMQFMVDDSLLTFISPDITVTFLQVNGLEAVGYDEGGDGDGEPMPVEEDNVVDLPKKAGGGNVH